MTIEDFKKIKITAMKEKNKDAVSALNLVINKLMLLSIEKKAEKLDMTDADTSSVLQKAVKELEEEKLAFEKAGRTESVESLEKQIDTVKSYLPKLLTEEEIRNIISSLPDKSIPSVMKHFKTNYAGAADMGVVNKIARSM